MCFVYLICYTVLYGVFCIELDQLSLEYRQKVQILNNVNIRENELKVEVLNLQKNLQTTQQHFTESETEVLYIWYNVLLYIWYNVLL